MKTTFFGAVGRMKKQSIVALVLFLLIPLVARLGGALFSAINPEAAAGHPDYVRNYHRLHLLKMFSMWGSFALIAALWLLVCFLAICSKKRSPLWLLLAAFGPIGFAVLTALDDRDPAGNDSYTQFQRRLNRFLRAAWEPGFFVAAWMLATEVMTLHQNWMIHLESARTGLSPAQIVNIRDASGGMWAFSEGNEVMYLVVLFYLLLPLIFRIVSRSASRFPTLRAG